MPGLVGFTCGDTARADCTRALDAMAALVTYRDFYGVDEAFCDGVVCAGRAHTRILQPQPQPAVAGGIRVWLEGEFLNRDEVRARHGVQAVTDPGILAELAGRGDDFSFLRDIEGSFVAVVYDTERSLLHLITDRYGFRHLYYSERGGRVSWASEFKAFAKVPGFDLAIDTDTVERVFSVGWFTGDGTWLEGVSLVPGATVLTWSLPGKERETSTYWSYDEIEVMDPVPGEDELIEEWARLFEESVARCCRGARVGALLSGGLDSRAVVAAMPREVDPVPLLTFGQRGSDDVEIARRVAAVRAGEHHVELFDETSWLEHRFEGVWWTDGQANVADLHGAFTVEKRREWFDVNVSGFIGDLNMGGSYVHETPQDEFDAMNNRVRRFTSVGLRTAQPFCENRLPFAGNALIEFSFAIPGSLRRDHYLYNKLLLRHYPDYYRTIPWQKTGVPITWPHRLATAARYVGSAAEKVKSRLAAAGLSPRRQKYFGSYDRWMRREPARGVLEGLLTDPGALYRGYIGSIDVADLWRRHLAGENLGSRVGMAVTFELFLQQLFKGKYREGPTRDSLKT